MSMTKTIANTLCSLCWLLFLRVVQENKGGCFFLNTVYIRLIVDCYGEKGVKYFTDVVRRKRTDGADGRAEGNGFVCHANTADCLK